MRDFLLFRVAANSLGAKEPPTKRRPVCDRRGEDFSKRTFLEDLVTMPGGGTVVCRRSTAVGRRAGNKRNGEGHSREATDGDRPCINMSGGRHGRINSDYADGIEDLRQRSITIWRRPASAALAEQNEALAHPIV